MEKQIAVGTWIPRTKIHLQEFNDFVRRKDLGFGKSAVNNCLKRLNIDQIDYFKEDIDYVIAKSTNISITYTEDGIIYVWGEDYDALVNYFDNTLLPSLGFLYSKGSPIPQLIKDMSEREHVTRKIIPNINIEKDGQKVLPDFKLYEYVVFFEEFNSILRNALNVYRTVWESVNEIRNRDKIRYSDLPKVRDTLINLKKDTMFFKSNIIQMEGFMQTREDLIQDYIIENLKKLKELNFDTLKNMGDYFEERLVMTEEYVDTTLDLVKSMYEENEQKEIKTLQIIFIISAVASVLSLGAMPSTDILTWSPSGELINTSKMLHFDIHALLVYGSLTVFVGAFMYYVLHFVFKSSHRFRLKKASKGLDNKQDDQALKEVKKFTEES